MPLKEHQLISVKALNLETSEDIYAEKILNAEEEIKAEIQKETEKVQQMMIRTDELEKMLQILKLNLHAENTEIRILLRELKEKLGAVDNKQEVTIQKLSERRGFFSRLKYLFSGF